MFEHIFKFHNLNFDKASHPRVPAGTSEGGQFTHTGGLNGSNTSLNEGTRGNPPTSTLGSPAKDIRSIPDGNIPGYGVTTAGATSIIGTHYSKEKLTFASGDYYGTGLKGAERTRLQDPNADARIKSRVYFYVDEGNGVTPESGVGPYPHKVRLNNLYDFEKDGAAVWRRGKGDLNASEKAVLDAGYDGYYVRNAANLAGVAVVLGSSAIPLQQVIKKEDTSMILLKKLAGYASLFKSFVESQHPRAPKGGSKGGQFSSKGGSTGGDAPSPETSLFGSLKVSIDLAKIAHAKANVIFTKSSAADKRLTNQVTGAILKFGGAMRGLVYRVKEANSLARKIATDSLKEQISPDAAARKIGDGLRYTGVFSPETYSSEVMSVLAAIKKEGHKIVKFKNFWGPTAEGKDPDYQGININMKTPEGIKWELQLHTPSSYHMKEKVNHKFYEERRKLDADTPEGKARSDVLTKIMSDYQKNVTVPKGSIGLLFKRSEVLV